MDAPVSAILELRPATELRFRLAALGGLVPCLESRGVSPEAVLQPFGLTRSDLVDENRTATYAVADALLRACAAATGCADVGLLIGQHVGLRTIGILGRLMANSRTVGEALANLRDAIGVQDSAVRVGLRRAGGRLVFAVDVPARGLHGEEHVYDTILAAGCGLIRGVCGAGWCPDEVHLRRAAPVDVRNYREFYRAPVRFGTGEVAMVFSIVSSAGPVSHSRTRSGNSSSARGSASTACCSRRISPRPLPGRSARTRTPSRSVTAYSR